MHARRSTARSPRQRLLMLSTLFLLAGCLPLVACGSGATGATSPTPLTVGLTYFPDIQFAPFYVADAKGYYKDAGLSVTFHHGIENNEFGLLAAGHEDAIFAGGDEALEARAQSGLPLVDVATMYQKYPVSLVVPADSPIQTAADLRGRTIGVPGPFGETYTGFLALLHSAGLTTSDVHVQSIGFTQVAALVGHKVDAVVGYTNNEPVQLAGRGFAIRTLDVWQAQPLVSNGLVVLESELQHHPEQVRALVKATLQGLRYTIDHPAEAVQITKAYAGSHTYNLDLSTPEKQAAALAVLEATIPLWQGSGKLGENDPATWQSMATFLQSVGLLKGTVDPKQSYTNAYLPA